MLLKLGTGIFEAAEYKEITPILSNIHQTPQQSLSGTCTVRCTAYTVRREGGETGEQDAVSDGDQVRMHDDLCRH